MIAINNNRLASKVYGINEFISKSDAKFVKYNGDHPENYLATMLGALVNGKTFIVGDNENTSSLRKYVINDDTVEKVNLEEDARLTQIIEQISLNLGNSDSASLVISTSGSVSSPKSVVFSYKAMLYRVKMIVQKYKLSEETKELIILPMTSAAIIFDQILPTLLVNGELYFLQGFDIFEIKKELYNVYDYTGITPTILNLLEKTNIVWNEVRVRNIAIGGEAINFEKINEISKRINKKIFYPMYGLTETGGAIVGIPCDYLLPCGAVGKIYQEIEAKIVNNVLFIRDHGLGEGYLKNAKIVKFTDDQGWFNTGDRAYLDKEGYLFIVGREKNIIIIGGINIYPEQIRNTINMFPGVIDSIVYGKKDNSDQFNDA